MSDTRVVEDLLWLINSETIRLRQSFVPNPAVHLDQLTFLRDDVSTVVKSRVEVVEGDFW